MIREISFKNKAHRWELEKMPFSGLTLLVGASGVGKTQILNSIMKLINISNGSAYNGVEWQMRFTACNKKNYLWTGEFETVTGIDQQEFNEKDISGSKSLKQIPRLMTEKLYLEDTLVFEREESRVKYEEKDVPKISPHISVLNLFITEDKISPVKEAFKKIMLLDYDFEKKYKITSEGLNGVPGLLSRAPEHMSGDSLEGNVPIVSKILMAWKLFKEKFEEILCDFKDIFPQVEDVRFKLLEEHDVYDLQIKERGTGWISRNEISSGMFKTLLHIAEMKLMSKGSVILIDEFENSLGVNCIDVVAGNLVNTERDLQYIITSHHPYIINNIDMKHWKVVIRKGTKVSARDAQQLKLGKSKHEAFKQLLNLEEFAEGIT